MKDFEWENRIIEFWTITGIVTKSEKRSETYVSGNFDKKSKDVNVTSDVVIKHEFWLKTPDGKEEEIQLSGYDIPLREGQEVSMLLAFPKGGEYSWYVALINHSAGKFWWTMDLMRLVDGYLVTSDKRAQWGLERYVLPGIAISAPLFNDSVFEFYDGFVWMGSVAALFLLCKFRVDVNESRYKSQAHHLLMQHIEGLIQQVFQQRNAS